MARMRALGAATRWRRVHQLSFPGPRVSLVGAVRPHFQNCQLGGLRSYSSFSSRFFCARRRSAMRKHSPQMQTCEEVITAMKASTSRTSSWEAGAPRGSTTSPSGLAVSASAAGSTGPASGAWAGGEAAEAMAARASERSSAPENSWTGWTRYQARAMPSSFFPSSSTLTCFSTGTCPVSRRHSMSAPSSAGPRLPVVSAAISKRAERRSATGPLERKQSAPTAVRTSTVPSGAVGSAVSILSTA
mmetsp:Transcript_49780/g.106378  ORF Transcript_49780/g.106378 Transcript_49780/m.106378 type:complete len:245 (+) Transcript_49780:312-1046(+)